MYTARSVFALLEEDRILRGKAITVDCDAALIREAPHHGKWGMHLPTIIPNREFVVRHPENAVRRLCEYAPFLTHISFDNLLLAGGACQLALTGKFPESTDPEDTDLDFFITGIKDPLLATYRVEACLVELRRDGWAIDGAIRSGSALTYRISNGTHRLTIQFILRAYRCPSQVLLGFDMGSCAVGFDGGPRLLFTPLSHFAYATGMNIVDPLHRSTTYERRLIKYWRRGFGIIMPHLGALEIGPTHCCRQLSKRAVAGKLMLFGTSRYQNMIKCGGAVYGTAPKSDYTEDPCVLYDFIDSPAAIPGIAQAKHAVLSALMCGSLLYYKYDRRPDEVIGYPLPPNTIPGCTDISHGFIAKGSIQSVVEDVFSTTIGADDTYNLKVAKKFLSSKEFEIFVGCIARQESQRASEFLCESMSVFVERCGKLLSKVDHSLRWVVYNPGDQGFPLITGSCHPRMETPQEWYGDQFLEDPFESSGPAKKVASVDQDSNSGALMLKMAESMTRVLKATGAATDDRPNPDPGTPSGLRAYLVKTIAELKAYEQSLGDGATK